MAFLGRYGSVSPMEYDEMEPGATLAYAREVAKIRQQEVDLMLNLARFVSGARMAARAEEVR